MLNRKIISTTFSMEKIDAVLLINTLKKDVKYLTIKIINIEKSHINSKILDSLNCFIFDNFDDYFSAKLKLMLSEVPFAKKNQKNKLRNYLLHVL